MISEHKGARLAQIDVLRGVAAMSVVVFHLAGHCARYFKGFPFSFEYGRYGVQLFFVISGFFIFSTVEKCRSTQEFVLLRFSRLYPAYWATLLMLMAVDVLVLKKPIWISGYAANATMLQSFMGIGDIDIVFWSLAVEMTFYALMASLMATKAIRHPYVVVALWLLASLAWPLVAESRIAQITFVKALSGIFSYGPFFAAGMLLYLLHKDQWRKPVLPIALIALCTATEFSTGGFETGVVLVLVSLLMASALRGYLSGLVNPVTIWLGAISFSLYLIHRNLGYLLLFKLVALGVDSRVAFAIVLVGALCLASALTYWIELPSLAFLRKALATKYSSRRV